jgi:hypothetical protein
VPLQGHWERVNTPLRKTTSRERRILWILVAALGAAAVAAVVVAIGSSSPATPAGCIRIEIPSTMGASASTLCGDKASSFCRSAAAHSEPLNATALPRCRAAGFD